MPSGKQIPVTEYLIDAMCHIQHVAGKVQYTIERGGEKELKPKGPLVFGRGCEVSADLLPPPFGHGCLEGPKDIRGPRVAAARRRTARRSVRARKQVKR